MKVFVAQLAPVVGDVRGNTTKVIAAMARAHACDADVVLFPELTVCGYPPRDLLDRADLLDACDRAVAEVAAATARFPGLIAVFGAPVRDHGLRNSAVVAHGGVIVAVRHKALLPCYDVFDEPRWFVPERAPRPVSVRGLTLGVIVCEDAWNEPGLVEERHYALDPVAAMEGSDVVLNLSASPFHAGKSALRGELVARQARQAGAPFVYANQVGGNDELVFDGGSFAVDAEGALLGQAAQFVEDDLLVDLNGRGAGAVRCLPREEETYAALVLGTRDYAARTGFRAAVLGLSGGIDSAVVACIAADALGADAVLGVGMPGPYSSPGSVHDARALATNLGVHWEVVPIGSMVDAFLGALSGPLAGKTAGVTEENLQSRVRGTVLMGLSNATGRLLLTTGNKSEVAVGYCTLYGDMNGGIAPIADLYKTEVYALARWMNRDGERIPVPTITKPPSAELRPDQTDQDSLPPYEVLDRILRLHIEHALGPEAIVARGEDPALVRDVLALVRRAEFKRWQMAPGLRVSPRAFGVGRRIPLAARNWA